MREIPSLKNLALPLLIVGSLFVAQLQRAREAGQPGRLPVGLEQPVLRRHPSK